ncbi:Shikimate dehydrogenase (NADP(+)) [Commensalibacter sp. Nvir]|uniref:shikimate dehydrogenase n=1 Tax=Commensalibacter sp. Nvir TaxID=3069817 RepID=UPI002D5816FF|nr:Shikimate dehydrogenase (NADP(+)) [Commensalibacter sp. Nvir]
MITGKAKIAAVIGWPIAHSRSPLLHNFWIKRYHIDGAYVPLAVKPQDFLVVINGLVRAGFKGCNVTIPHKECAFQCCDDMDDAAHRTRSVNTLVFKENGKIYGTSTDGAGYIESLKSRNIPLAKKNVLILGAGGASRSLLYALHTAGCQVSISNRTLSKALQLIDDMKIGNVISWQDWPKQLDQFDLMVNTTALGMHSMDDYDFNLEHAPTGLIVSDIVYVPRETPLLKKARSLNLLTVDGLGMLLYQARLGFFHWFGVYPEIDENTVEFIANSLK